MVGITESTFESNELNSEVFAESAAESMSPLTSDDIHIANVVDVSTHRLLRRLSSSEVDVTYVVVFTLDADRLNQGITGQEAYEYFNASLVSSVNSGEFNQYLATNAVSLGATDMGSVTTTRVAVGPLAEIGSDDSDDKKHDDTALVVGLVVGIGGGLILLCVCVVSIMRRRHKVTNFTNAGAP